MKKTMFAVLIAMIALGVVTGVASAQTTQQGTGILHDYMVQALADKLGIPLATVEAQIDGGNTLYQIALDNGIAEADLPAFLLEVRTTAINAALADGVITQDLADRMLQSGGYGMGQGMRRGGMGSGVCTGTGIPVGLGMHRGGR
jgi:hypothetical protein